MFDLERGVEVLDQFEPLCGLFGELGCVGLQDLGLRVQLLLVHIRVGHSAHKTYITYAFATLQTKHTSHTRWPLCRQNYIVFMTY